MLRGGVLLFTTLLSGAATAQTGVLNTTVFRRGDSAVLQAVWQLEPRALHYRRVTGDSTITAVYQTDIRLLRDADTVLHDGWRTQTPAAPPAQAVRATLLDAWEKPVAAGTYSLLVRITEPGFEASAFTLRRQVEVEKGQGGIGLSQPQLLDTFYRDARPGPFRRGSLQVIPLAADFLADERRTIHVYVQASGLAGVAADRSPLRWKLGVYRRDELLPQTLKTEAFSATDASLVASLPIGTVPSGNYALRAVLEDRNGTALATAERPFQRSNAAPDPVATAVAADTLRRSDTSMVLPNLKKTFVAEFKPSQMSAVLRMILPISTPEEGLAIQSLLRNPDPDFVRPFVYQIFAQRRSGNPDAEWRSYADAVRAVNRLYRAGTTVGYETERGRVQLRYGPPDERITVATERGTRPYEVWRYNSLQGGAAAGFLFYQPGSLLDDYQLLHSTASGETRNPQWRRYLYTEPQAGERSRAEQYFPTR